MARRDLKTITLAAGLGSVLMFAPLAATAQMKPVLPNPRESPEMSAGGNGTVRSGEGAPSRGRGMLDRGHRAKHVKRSNRNTTKAARKSAPMPAEATGTTVPAAAAPAPMTSPGVTTTPPQGGSPTGDKAPPAGAGSAPGKMP